MWYRHAFTFLAPLAVVAVATAWKRHSATPPAFKKRTSKKQPLIHHKDFEQHSVITEDDVTLSLLHLTRNRKSQQDWTPPKKVVLLLHGLFDSSETWLLNGPAFSLPYLLADAEWDVWIADSRGNTYSPTGDGDYTWDEMARNDVPAFVSHIKLNTGATRVALVGHSQGAVEILAALAERALSPRDVSGLALLAPPAIMKHQQSQFIGSLASMRVDRAIKHLPDSMFRSTINLLRRIVGTTGLTYDASFRYMFGRTKLLEGSNYHGHFPAPTSVKNVCHWIQMSRTGQFDHYSESSKPSKVYNLDNLSSKSVKIATFSGTNDLLATPRDIDLLNKQLEATSNLAQTKMFDGYAHMDFTWSLDAIRTVYPAVLRFLNGTCATQSTRQNRSWLRMPQEKPRYLEPNVRSSAYRTFTDSFRGRQ